MTRDSFALSELRQSLSEIDSWGIESFQILDSDQRQQLSSDKATAGIVLLEGSKVSIECSESGWKVLKSNQVSNLSFAWIRTPSINPFLLSLQAFDSGLLESNHDTLDDLLLAVSPKFEQKRMEKLFEKLSEVANERSETTTTNGEDFTSEYGEYDDGVERKAT
jgi:hypothetical protein